MGFFGNIFLHSFAVFSIFGHHTSFHHQFFPSLTPTLTGTEKMITATTDLNQLDKTIHLKASFPQSGGVVTGTITGDCTGGITGFYSGDNSGKQLHGKVLAHCPILFFTIDAWAGFNGVVNNDDTSAQINYTASVGHANQTGTFTFSLSTQ